MQTLYGNHTTVYSILQPLKMDFFTNQYIHISLFKQTIEIFTPIFLSII